MELTNFKSDETLTSSILVINKFVGLSLSTLLQNKYQIEIPNGDYWNGMFAYYWVRSVPRVSIWGLHARRARVSSI